MNKTVIDDAEEASFSLNGMVAGFDENTSAYAHMPTKNPYSHFCFALSIEMTVEEVIAALKKYLAELERGECREVLCIEKKMMRKEYWAKNGLLRRNLLAMRERLEREKMVSKILKLQNGASYDDFLNRLEDSYAEVARLLSEIHRKLTRQMYGRFYQYLKSQYDTEHVVMAYDEWMMTEGDDTFETLKGKQTLEVAKFLRKDRLRFLRTPIQSESDKVDIDKVIYWMPCNYDRKYLRSDEFRIQCAKFRKFNSWKGNILKLDYDALGEYLFKNYYKMTDKDRQAFFDLDMMMELINKDIAKVMPKNEEEVQVECSIDQKLKKTIEKLEEEGTLKNLYDYTWIMSVMNETKGLPDFYTPSSLISYLKNLHIERLPSEDSINIKQNTFSGTFPDWIFTNCDSTEAKRRINVGKRFLNIFRAA